jgi:hypothetical protein
MLQSPLDSAAPRLDLPTVETRPVVFQDELIKRPRPAGFSPPALGPQILERTAYSRHSAPTSARKSSAGVLVAGREPRRAYLWLVTLERREKTVTLSFTWYPP